MLILGMILLEIVWFVIAIWSWIITGYKGGYETYKDFGTNLLKEIWTKEEIKK